MTLWAQHEVTTYELPPGSNFELVCSCGQTSGILLGRKADVRALARAHEETGAPFPQGLQIVTWPKSPDA